MLWKQVWKKNPEDIKVLQKTSYGISVYSFEFFENEYVNGP